ncbi:MAG: hypothetical protein ACR2KV_11495 [Solirubrobacteraceae bacterium]
MRQTTLSPAPRLLLFPQVARPEIAEGRPAVRRYSLTLLHGGSRSRPATADGPGAPAGG